MVGGYCDLQETNNPPYHWRGRRAITYDFIQNWICVPYVSQLILLWRLIGTGNRNDGIPNLPSLGGAWKTALAQCTLNFSHSFAALRTAISLRFRPEVLMLELTNWYINLGTTFRVYCGFSGALVKLFKVRCSSWLGRWDTPQEPTLTYRYL